MRLGSVTSSSRAATTVVGFLIGHGDCRLIIDLNGVVAIDFSIVNCTNKAELTDYSWFGVESNNEEMA